MKWTLGHTLKGVAAALVLVSMTAAPARAGFTINLDSTAPSGANTVFNYSAAIDATDQIVTGDFFRIYDFNGYVAGSITAPAGWTASVANSNPTPPPDVILSHGDDGTIPNLIFTYTGAASIPGPTVITGFSATSTFPFLGVVKDFAGRNTKNSATDTTSKVDSTGDIRVPGPVPEPASVVSLLLGGGLIAFAGRRVCKVKLAC
jgi:hypothetical protein